MIKRFCERFRSQMRPKNRILAYKKSLEIELWTGIRHKIPLCCILFYESVWRPSIKNQIAEYAKTMADLTNNDGVILCPDCIAKKIHN